MENEAYRIEHDSMGEVRVPRERLYGAQTQRSVEHFPIGVGLETMPREIIMAFAYLKKAAARVNHRLQPARMDAEKLSFIEAACDRVLQGELMEEFPLVVWQTGSGTQSNMNMNEVIANCGNLAAGRALLHPNDDINMSQSSNDTFPTALHIAACLSLKERVIPALLRLAEAIGVKEERYRDTIKVGRTHLMDAVPLTFGQELGGYRASLELDLSMIEKSLEPLRALALGGTAVGTGLNAPEGFGELAAQEIAHLTSFPFETAPNKFHALTSRDEIVFAHGALKALAADLFKIANDIRLLASGPRAGLSEVRIPANEPGSSIMPGKVNPTQCEQVTMVATQVMGNDAAIGFGASQGHFELNVFMPVIAYNFLQSSRLLAESMEAFTTFLVEGLEADEAVMGRYMQSSLMLVTSLSPHMGYEKAAEVAHKAFLEGTSLKEAALSLGYISEEDFDRLADPRRMV